MKHLLCFFFFAGWSLLSGFAQGTHLMGLQLDDEEYRRLPHASETIQIAPGRKSLIRKVDLTPYCPEIRDQGTIASCVGWSLGYGAMTVERAIRSGWSDSQLISEKANSALFIYNQINLGDCGRGVSMPQALEFVKEKGNCLARDFDFQVKDCQEEVPVSLVEKAEAYRIEDFIPLFQPEAEAEEKIKKIKLVLSQNKPVVVGMVLRRNFLQIKSGERSWWPGLGDTIYAGTHAMVVVGFDDDQFKNPLRKNDPNMEGAFRLMNSWGKNWGEEGFIWIRYAHFAEFCRHAYAIRLADSDPVRLENQDQTQIPAIDQVSRPETAEQKEEVLTVPDHISGAFSFRRFQGWDQSISPASPVFQNEKVQLVDNGHYALGGDCRPGDQFQLQVRSDFDNGYIYVLSVDPAGKAEIHFPKSEAYNVQFKGLNESALILFSGSQLTIPSTQKVLELKQTGKDHLIVLFSTQKIKPEYLKLLADQLAIKQNEPINALYELLGKEMVPLSSITYESGEMRFEVSIRDKGKIVPVVLTVDVSQ